MRSLRGQIRIELLGPGLGPLGILSCNVWRKTDVKRRLHIARPKERKKYSGLLQRSLFSFSIIFTGNLLSQTLVGINH